MNVIGSKCCIMILFVSGVIIYAKNSLLPDFQVLGV
jgi:hypothetical protein